MKADFWHDKWNNNEIGFDQDQPNPLLVEHWQALNLEANARVFVPLCGKSIDMVWLLHQGHQVVGVELSEDAIEQFFAAIKVKPEVWTDHSFKRYSAQNIEVLVGDYFKLNAELLGSVDATYDRASLVALPADMRTDYTQHLQTITATAPQLLITFDYDQSQQAGPPFAIPATEVKDHYNQSYAIQQLASVPVKGGLKGGCDALEQVWALSEKCRSE